MVLCRVLILQYARLLLACCLIGCIASAALAQTEKTIRLPRIEASKLAGKNDRIAKIWLPRDYSSKKRYPLILTFLAKDAKIIANIAEYYGSQIPQVIVVGIEPEINDIGFSYETAKLNEDGQQLAAYISDQLIPYLEKNYSLAKFRGFVGHSYTANYTDFLLREHPSWFNAYALVSPEMPSYTTEYASLISKLPKPFYYYLVSAKGDIERRQTYAQKIGDQLSKITDKSFHFKSEFLTEADHNTSVPHAIGSVLEFFFSDFKNYTYEPKSGSLSAWFKALKKEKEDLFGFGIQIDSSTAAEFFFIAVDQKDLAALKDFEGFFLTKEADASVPFNLAQAYYRLGEYEQARTMFYKSIEKSKKTNRSDFLLMSYRTIALQIDSIQGKQPEAAWKVLETGYKDSKDVAFKYFFGMISARHGYRLDDGIRILNEFEAEREQSFFGTLYKLDQVYVLLAKCYLQKNDKMQSAIYTDKALKVNPENEDAQALKKGTDNR